MLRGHPHSAWGITQCWGWNQPRPHEGQAPGPLSHLCGPSIAGLLCCCAGVRSPAQAAELSPESLGKKPRSEPHPTKGHCPRSPRTAGLSSEPLWPEQTCAHPEGCWDGCREARLPATVTPTRVNIPSSPKSEPVTAPIPTLEAHSSKAPRLSHPKWAGPLS